MLLMEKKSHLIIYVHFIPIKVATIAQNLTTIVPNFHFVGPHTILAITTMRSYMFLLSVFFLISLCLASLFLIFIRLNILSG